MKKILKKIRKTREYLLQKLYEIEIKKETHVILSNINKNKIKIKYIKSAIKTIIKKKNIITLLRNTKSFDIKNINIIEKIIIDIAIFEFFFYKKILKKIIINEAIILAKRFCNKNTYTIINKILENILN